MFLPIVILAQALYITGPGGDVYMAANEVPEGSCVMSGAEELVYEVNNFNTCNEIVLEPGCYRAELRGGVGLANADCVDYMAQSETFIVSALFSLSETVTAYALRGGDGNAGSVNKSGSRYGTFGGGASGVDSILVVDGRTWRAEGGEGNTCTISENNSVLNRLYSRTATAIGNGFGGKADLDGSENGYCAYGKNNTEVFGVGGGGGGAPDGLGGTKWQYKNSFPDTNMSIGLGADGSATGGGNGGDVVSCKTYKCTELLSATGGQGGATVQFLCGGAIAVSYGGGGGGGSVYGTGSSGFKANGGNGGSGSTGTSSTSFVRIYKM